MKTLDDKQVQTLIDEFYSEFSEDIVGLFAIEQAVEDLIPNADAAREQTLQIVDSLLSKGMALVERGRRGRTAAVLRIVASIRTGLATHLTALMVTSPGLTRTGRPSCTAFDPSGWILVARQAFQISHGSDPLAGIYGKHHRIEPS